MPTSFYQPQAARGRGGAMWGTGATDQSQRGIHGPATTHSWTHGDQYGSGPMGLPVMRVTRDGRPGGYMINFGGSWMDMNEFNDPSFQRYFFEPWARQQRQESAASFREANPGVPLGLLQPMGEVGGSRGAGPVGSRSTRGASGYNVDPNMIAQLLGG